MMYIALFLLFFLGLIVGSFLNVVVYRLEDKKRKNIRGRSFCPHCREKIKAYDLVPVLSWVILKGKCRNCKKEISVQYPLVELATGLVFAILGYVFLQGLSFSIASLVNLVFWFFFAGCIITVFVYDLKHQIIPDEIIYTALVVALVFVGLNTVLTGNFKYLTEHFLAGLLAGGFFYSLAAVSKGKWMGGGDIKLVAFIGLVLGWKGALIALYTAFILGALIGSFFLLIGRKKMGSKIPFGPFLVIGTFIGFLFGEQIVNFYVSMFM